ncbi:MULTISPECIES: tyrosine-type recombinase/integrase [unclassified Pseudomonas]|uniref:tyrosine-type recombinase/integrase n=1 Tax=unclassified Pseudomonas TaxID=196821 RepID=UPI000CD105CD|nr:MULTISPECIES: tyrosine-type recombinase/integrase [unclassified Pseudomonas]POA28210.1 hypothetical protein C1887_25010 [Pseudomonas sp. GW456-R21]POA62110.1 hypothetical protein C1884_27615 [Pseudomonas sp. GW460-R15]
MRVPIYPADLLPKAAFKKLTKCVQKRWPGQSPVPLSLARETISRGLGYDDYHDVMQSSTICPPGAPAPSESDVHSRISAAVINVLKLTDNNSVKPSELKSFVTSLPLKALSTYKVNYPREEHQLTNRNANIDPEESRDLPSKKLGIDLQLRKSRSLASPVQPLSRGEIEAIRRVVKRSGHLRDQSLLAMFESGLRAHSILGAKVSSVETIASTPHLVVASKGKPPVLIEQVEVLRRYMAAENLSLDDYLFPSMKDPKQPMSEVELARVFSSWEKEARLPPARRTPHSLRVGLIKQRMRLLMSDEKLEITAIQIGHTSPRVTSHYLLSDVNEMTDFNKAETDH